MRRRLSTAIVKANISVLLGRLGMVGEGAAMARGRRQWSSFEEMRMRREREAAWRAETTGREVCNVYFSRNAHIDHRVEIVQKEYTQ